MNEPTPSQTPETDACWELPYASKFHRGLAMMDKARTLERQRNEARAERDALADALRGLNKLNLCGRAYEEIETALATLDLKP